MRKMQSFKKCVTITVLSTVLSSLYSCTTSSSSVTPLKHDDSVAIYKAMVKTYQFGRPNAVWGDSIMQKGGERIHPDVADKMIKAFQADQDNSDFPIQNLEGKALKGFYIKRDIFDTLINQKKASGIRLLFAKHRNANNKAYTLVIYGTKKVNKDGSDDNAPTMGVYENIDPCPNNCGNN